jgi:hypothetical protein
VWRSSRGAARAEVIAVVAIVTIASSPALTIAVIGIAGWARMHAVVFCRGWEGDDVGVERLQGGEHV